MPNKSRQLLHASIQSYKQDIDDMYKNRTGVKYNEDFFRDAMEVFLDVIEEKSCTYNKALFDEIVSCFDDLQNIDEYQTQILSTLKANGYPYDYFKVDALKDITNWGAFAKKALEQVFNYSNLTLPDKSVLLKLINSLKIV